MITPRWRYCSEEHQGDFMCRVLQCFAVLLSFQAFGQEPPPEARAVPSSEETPPVLVISGAVSLGAWQAGFLDVYTRWWLSRCGDSGCTYPVVTGASAGATNAFISAVALQKGRLPSSMQDSPFFQVWVKDLDWKNLTRDGKPIWPIMCARQEPRLHAFDDAAIESAVGSVSRYVQAASRPDRSIPEPTWWGVTATRMNARQIQLGDRNVGGQIALAQITESLNLEISAGGSGPSRYRETPELIRAAFACDDLHAPECRAGPVACLTDSCDKEIPLDGKGNTLQNILAASGAFPLAFAPRELRLHYPGETSGVFVPDTAQLVDGGILENNPVALALRLMKGKHLPESARILYLDPDVQEPGSKAGANIEGQGVIAKYGRLLGGLTSTVPDLHLGQVLRDKPSVALRLQIPRRAFALGGEHVVNFSGFVSKGLRTHDYVRGQLDALAFLEENGRRSGATVRSAVFTAPEVAQCYAKLARGNVDCVVAGQILGLDADTREFVARALRATGEMPRDSKRVSQSAAELLATFEYQLQDKQAQWPKDDGYCVDEGYDAGELGQCAVAGLEERLDCMWWSQPYWEGRATSIAAGALLDANYAALRFHYMIGLGVVGGPEGQFLWFLSRKVDSGFYWNLRLGLQLRGVPPRQWNLREWDLTLGPSWRIAGLRGLVDLELGLTGLAGTRRTAEGSGVSPIYGGDMRLSAVLLERLELGLAMPVVVHPKWDIGDRFLLLSWRFGTVY